jgi:hypothetical protein
LGGVGPGKSSICSGWLASIMGLFRQASVPRTRKSPPAIALGRALGLVVAVPEKS